MKENPVYRPIVIPTLIFAVIAAISGLFWLHARQHTRQIMQTKVDLTTDLAADRLQRYFNERINLIDSMRQDWLNQRIRDLTEFQEQARKATEILDGFQAINWIDPEGIIQWVYPEKTNLPARGKNLREHPAVAPVLQTVDRTGAIGTSPPIDLYQGERGFAIYFPLQIDGRNAGYLNAAFRFRPVLATCFQGRITTDFWYVVQNGTEDLLTSPDAPHNLARGEWGSRPVQVANETWEIKLIPKPPALAAIQTNADNLIFALGLSLALALSILSSRFLQGRESLRTRTSELEAIYEAYPDLQFLLAPDGTILDYQASEKSRLYLPPEEFMGKKMQDLLPPKVGAQCRNALEKLRTGATMVQFEYALELPGGRQYYESRILPISEKELIVIARNITRRYQSEEKLRQSEEKHRQIVDTAQEGIWVIDAEAQTTFANQRMAEMLGYTVDEMLRRPLFDFVAAEVPTEAENEFKNCLQGIRKHHELQFQHRDGTTIWTTVACNPLQNEQGEFIGTLAMVSDIGERRRITQALQQLAEDVSGAETVSFFESIVLRIAAALGVEYAYIGLTNETDTAGEWIETLAVCHQGKIIPNFKYDLRGTPCQNVLQQKIRIFPKAVATLFPQDELLREMKIESYAGMPLVDSNGHAIGLLVLLHSAELPHQESAERLLKVFGVRCAAELELLQIKNQLRQSKERLKIVVDNLPGVVFSYTRHADGRRTSNYLSPGLAELVGDANAVDALWHEEEQFEKLIHPVDHERLLKYRAELRDTEKIVDFEFRVRTATGAYRWLRSLARPLPQNNGDVQCHGILLDINQQKTAEQMIERERRLFMDGPVAVVRWSAQPGGDIDYFSANVNEFLGYEARDFIQGKRTYSSTIHPQDRERVYQEIDEYIAKGRSSFDQTYRIIRADGTIRNVFDYTIVERDDQDKATHYDGYMLDITDLQEANAALQASEERFRTVVTNAQPIIFAIDQHGIFTLSEGLSLSALGLKPGEAVGQSAFEMYRNFPRLVAGLRAALIGESYRDELEVNGLYFDIVISPLKTGTQVTGAMGMAIDITEHKKAEQTLAESQQRLALHVKHTPLGVIEWNLDSEIVEWNPGAERIFGYTADEVTGRVAAELILPPETHDQIQKIWDELITQSGGFRSTNDNLTQTGKVIRCEWYNTPLVDNEGNVLGVASLVQDITERILAEEALRDSEKRFRTMIEHAPEAIIVFDTDSGCFVDANGNACRLFKYRLEEMLKIGPPELSPKQLKDGRLSKPLVNAQIARALKGEVPVFEWTGLDSAGKTFPCEVRLVRLPATGRNLVRGTITDISERKKNERRQAFLIDELDHRVKNNLAAVLALTTQTIAAAESLEEFGEVFAGRIAALARTHEVLAASKWQGAWINDVVRLVLSPSMLPHEKNIRFAGENIILNARAAGPITMTLHELLTNSLKHGSLSITGGKLSVEWTISEKQYLQLEWRETGGPTITEPIHRGLGLTLIRGFIEHELDGKTKLEFKPRGLVCQIRVPLDHEESTIG